jgi:PAS domain S-box-containing protein
VIRFLPKIVASSPRARLHAAEPLIQESLIGEAIDHGPVAVLVAGDDMQYLAANEYAAELLGYTREELLELRLPDLARGQGVSERFEEVVAHRRHDGEETLTRKDGTEITAKYLTKETTVAGLSVFVAVMWPVREPAQS